MTYNKTLKICIVVSTYNKDITLKTLDTSIDLLKKNRINKIDTFQVPGAFEIPAAIRMNIKAMELVGGRRRYDGYIALGCVIRGETTHYDYVCGECARGLMDLSLEFSIAVGFGVLTVENEAQAWARASLDKGNKGGVVADAALRMIEVKREFGYFPR